MSVVARLAAMTLVFAFATPLVASETSPAVFTAEGTIDEVVTEGDQIAFQFSRPMRFSIRRSRTADADAMLAILKEALDSGAPVAVDYYVQSGGIDRATMKPTFIAARVRSGEREARGEDGRNLTRYTATAHPAELALARGLALHDRGRYGEARAALDEALAGEALAPYPLAIGLAARGNAVELDAIMNTLPGAGRDTLLLASLRDYRSWSALRPDNASARRKIAETLARLGAYDEALAIFHAAIVRWPQGKLWNAITLGMLYRAKGDFANALRALDDLEPGNGQDGMAFHYHRGWTLMLLGRHEEAIAEFTEGIRYQIDYPYAHLRRACALVQLGRLSEAIEDLETTISKAHTYPGLPTTEENYNLQQASIMIARLDREVSRGNARSRMSCGPFWDEGLDYPRSRHPNVDVAG